MQCQRCAGGAFTKAGRDRSGRQLSCCGDCGRRQTPRSASAFCGYRFPDDSIGLAVHWYLRFRLPYADLVELLAERGVHVDASTIVDGVQCFTPLYKEAAGAHRHRVGVRWAVDETYIRMAGRWVYAYRAIDEHGQVIDVYLSETRDTAAATTFFERAIDHADVRPRASRRTRPRPTRRRCGRSCRRRSISRARWSNRGSSATTNTSRGARGTCAASNKSTAPRWCATATVSCATCVMASTGWANRPATHASPKPRSSPAPGTTSRTSLPRHSCPCQAPTTTPLDRHRASDLSTSQRHRYERPHGQPPVADGGLCDDDRQQDRERDPAQQQERPAQVALQRGLDGERHVAGRFRSRSLPRPRPRRRRQQVGAAP